MRKRRERVSGGEAKDFLRRGAIAGVRESGDEEALERRGGLTRDTRGE
jgi:hypothetical protein